MNLAIYESLKSAMLFTDEEYAHWNKIIKLQMQSETFLEHVRTYMLSIHYNACADFVKRFVGNYSDVTVLLAPGYAQLTYFSPGFTHGVCGMRISVERGLIEVSRMQAQDRTMVAGLLTKIPVN